MKMRYVVATISAIALAFAASAAAASLITVIYVVDNASGNPMVTANLKLDVVGGYAIDGTGSLSSPYWNGYESMTLLTPSTPGVTQLGGGLFSYNFGNGSVMKGDTLFPIDSTGLVFSVSTPDNPGRNVGFNIAYSGGYVSFMRAVDIDTDYDVPEPDSDVSVTPLPGALPLLATALAALGGLGWLKAEKTEG